MADVNKRLREAVKAGSERELKSLLHEPGCDASSRDKYGLTALMWAAGRGHKACVGLLLPASHTLSKDGRGRTALMHAACHGHEACVRILLPISDARAKNENGRTALMWAAYGGQEVWLRILLPVSDVLAKDKDGATASAWARRRSCENSAQLIDAYALSQTEHAAIGVAVSFWVTRKRAAPRV